MYYINRSPSSSNIVHITTNRELYDERYLLEEFAFQEEAVDWAKREGKEICWCDFNPLAFSLNDKELVQ